MGKSCIRFKNIKKTLYELLGELFAKMTTARWIEWYKSLFKK